ncbi:ABC transporter permease subunit [Paenibacillus doosanensis]|uniref:Glutathione transport system permease protein GsiD n=1 Tax=Paenibacillus konkukensis TaxID=2020716 RepID=A0ABY4RTT0_9BACL|nr:MULTISPECIES: ABC transporter permease subunit [Paenibacillus]MCS7464280.1 ABC transporter permease subunit [Paenibacillus doosanensis]UQZ85478.1 Glutathione transport system permease protein GsiD [Paenibacillus konkukensis]
MNNNSTIIGAGSSEPSEALKPKRAKGRAAAFFSKFCKQRLSLAAGIFIVLLAIVALFGPYLTPFDPNEPDYDALMSTPSGAHWAGTDEYGRDIMSRLIAGTRLTLSVSLSAVLIAAVFGTILGLLSGYYGGWLDRLIMRSSDVLFSFPDLLLAIGIVAILGPGLSNVVIAVAVFGIPSFARIIRSVTLSAKETLFVEAARSMGAKNGRIIWKHIFPETVPSVIVNVTMKIGGAILAASSLSFLGMGAKPTEPDWGAMLSMGRDYLSIAPHIVYIPGAAIFLTVLAFNLVGDGLRDALDPKTKN